MAQKSELEHFLEETRKYIKLDFDLESPKADIKFCSESEWINQKEKNGPAFYNPKENKTYLGPDASIADLIHEYFGHALYSEQTTLGRKLRYYLETQKKEAKDLFYKLEPIQEGFSAWMEEKILKQLGLTDLWEQRRKLLAKSPYFEFYNSFLKEEAEKGTLTLLYKLGFPKSKNKDILRKIAEENLKNFDGLKYIIQYGSLERDIDLVAIYSDNVIQKDSLVYDGCIDINVLSESSFLQKLNLYDIELLEPVLTGNLLIGNEKDFQKIKSDIKKGKPSDDAIGYADKRSLETFNSALFFYHQNRFKCNEALLNSDSSKKVAKDILEKKVLSFCSEDLLYTLNNLSFSLSYKLSAQHYNKKKSFTVLKDIIQHDFLKDLIAYIKDVENGKDKLTEHKTLEFINQTRNFLLNACYP